jgi:hypothetical protein
MSLASLEVRCLPELLQWPRLTRQTSLTLAEIFWSGAGRAGLETSRILETGYWKPRRMAPWL